MVYRRLSSLGDYTFGQGKGNYLSGVDATAQAILTRLRLYLGEWWEDQEDGLPMWQSILGARTGSTKAIDRLIQQRILGTPNVTEIINLSSSLEARQYVFTCTVNTAFGQVTITNQGGA